MEGAAPDGTLVVDHHEIVHCGTAIFGDIHKIRPALPEVLKSGVNILRLNLIAWNLNRDSFVFWKVELRYGDKRCREGERLVLAKLNLIDVLHLDDLEPLFTDGVIQSLREHYRLKLLGDIFLESLLHHTARHFAGAEPRDFRFLGYLRDDLFTRFGDDFRANFHSDTG